ncbi:MAG TPA: hypothetical protein VGH98_14020 [Gemmatimonadaceae bacterium]|jgi:hypothetical protein
MVHDHNAAGEWLRAARRLARQIVDDGVPWLVYELPPAPFDRRSSPSLVFETENAVRRVRVYPEDWRELPDHDLFALSWTY